eukprot:jgi/Chlat1/6915/Chrsp52S06591
MEEEERIEGNGGGEETARRRRRELHGPEWRRLSLQRTAAAGTLGAAAGAFMALSSARSVPGYAAAVGANCAIIAGAYCVAHEALHVVRPVHDVTRTALAGAGTGLLIGALHGGKWRAISAALLLACAGSATHAALDAVNSWRLRRILLASDETRNSVTVGEGQPQPNMLDNFTLPSWFPIRRLSEEEVNQRAAEELMLKELAMRRKMQQRVDEDERTKSNSS